MVPKLKLMVYEQLGACIPCLATTAQDKVNPVISTELPLIPWKQIVMDFAGPYPNGKYIMVVIDEYSRFPLVRVINSLQTETVSRQLKKIFMEFGLPCSLKTDNGPPMNGNAFTDFLQSFGIKHKKITPRWPQANGLVERFMKTIGKVIKASIVENLNWEDTIDEFLLSYRTTPHSTTKVSPATLLFKGTFKAWLPELVDSLEESDEEVDEIARQNDKHNKEKMARNADIKNNAEDHKLRVDDTVLVKQEVTNKYTTPFSAQPLTITQVDGTMITAKGEGKQITRNSSHFKKVKGNDTNNNTEVETNTSEETTVVNPKKSKRTIHKPVFLEDYILN